MSLLSLQKYAEWYYTRYFPSIRVLREKIQLKSQDCNMVDEVMEALKPLFVEKNIIESRVHDYISQGKTLYFIRQKLSQKKYDTVLVQQILGEMKDIFETSEIYRNVIQARCKKAKNKGFSRKKILYELLGQYPDACDIIDQELQSYNDIEILENIVLPKLLRLHAKEKTFQKCLQAGFGLRDIQKAFSNNDF